MCRGLLKGNLMCSINSLAQGEGGFVNAGVIIGTFTVCGFVVQKKQFTYKGDILLGLFYLNAHLTFDFHPP